MKTTAKPQRGRPRLSSREMLEDAAFELFLEKGYAGTTVEEITQRAGVSRNTFFNYFPGKSDVFWVDLDAGVEALAVCLAAQPTESALTTAVENAILTACEPFGPSRVPWALTHHELIGSVRELQSSALGRLTAQAHMLSAFTEQRLGLPAGSMPARAFAYSAIGAIVAAAQAWADTGPSRGELAPFVRLALAPVLDGFGRSLSP
jgi:AcrR family transcriptional regulator